MAEIKKNFKWVALFLAVIVVCLAVMLVSARSSSPAACARITSEGSLLRTVDLQNVTEPYEFTVTNSEGGENVIRVENGKIAVISASCPDKLCVKRGYISTSLSPIVCLPNKLSVSVMGVYEDGIDAVSGGDAR